MPKPKPDDVMMEAELREKLAAAAARPAPVSACANCRRRDRAMRAMEAEGRRRDRVVRWALTEIRALKATLRGGSPR